MAMDGFYCDYECGTVGESIAKYHIPDDWCAEFDACDGICPILCIPVGQIRKAPAMIDLKLRVAKNEADEYAGCMVLAGKRTIAFKVEFMHDLVKALKAMGK